MAPAGTLAAQVTNKLLGRGSIFHAYSEIAGKGKYIAGLNSVWPPPDGIAVYAFFTTQVERFRKARIPPTAYLEIEVGDYEFCAKPTIFDLTDIRRRPVHDILSAGMFSYCGAMKPDHLSRADAIIETSTYVSKLNKKAILG